MAPRDPPYLNDRTLHEEVAERPHNGGSRPCTQSIHQVVCRTVESYPETA